MLQVSPTVLLSLIFITLMTMGVMPFHEISYVFYRCITNWHSNGPIEIIVLVVWRFILCVMTFHCGQNIPHGLSELYNTTLYYICTYVIYLWKVNVYHGSRRESLRVFTREALLQTRNAQKGSKSEAHSIVSTCKFNEDTRWCRTGCSCPTMPYHALPCPTTRCTWS